MRSSSHIRAALITACIVAASSVYAQQSSVTLDGKPFSVNFNGAAAKGRKIANTPVPFGQLHAGADVVFKGATVPKGDYSLYVMATADKWQLIINKASAAKAATYDPKLDAGRVAMVMAKSPAAVETPRATLSKVAALAAKIELAAENTIATAQFRLDRVAGDSEW